MNYIPPQIFLCFSNKDRKTVVQSMMHHLKNYGMNVWYDYHETLLGDDLYESNFEKGILQTKYAIVILSNNFLSSKMANKELDLIFDQKNSKNITIFPIFYNITPDFLPCSYKWIKELKYREVTKRTGTLSTCHQIVCKIFSDLINNIDFQSNEDNLGGYFADDSYFKLIIKFYKSIDKNNLNARIATLFSIYFYIKNHYPEEIPKFVDCIFERLMAYTKLSIKLDNRELQIMEKAIIFINNQYLSK